jgi:hypothetical protein
MYEPCLVVRRIEDGMAHLKIEEETVGRYVPEWVTLIAPDVAFLARQAAIPTT